MANTVAAALHNIPPARQSTNDVSVKGRESSQNALPYVMDVGRTKWNINNMDFLSDLTQAIVSELQNGAFHFRSALTHLTWPVVISRCESAGSNQFRVRCTSQKRFTVRWATLPAIMIRNAVRKH